LQTFFDDIGLSNDVLCTQFVGFVVMVQFASCVIGQHRDAATVLKAKYPQLKTFHCMAHRLELAVKNSVDTVNNASHFRMFVQLC